ncbi:FGE-sulfatase domain-containing protein [Sandaracinus amylolyticus]|nr:FGE-sulfatase domain-containing protein [Sandaracinus amylolyticus]
MFGPDAGRPGERDVGPERLDSDSDGVDRAVDCDDGDPLVGSVATRECTSTCGVGTERCHDGAWTACDAETDCECASPGTSRNVGCGRCGVAAQTCGEDRRWSVLGECLNEGECSEGQTETDRSRCGESRRACDATCSWGDWVVVAPSGECEPGETREIDGECPAGMTRIESCTLACGWESAGDCAFRCERAPHTSLSGADPVCVPAGPFVLGVHAGPLGSPESPETTVVLSEFYIDRYPVTKARYELCRAAGICPAPVAASASEYDALAPGDVVRHVPEGAEAAFCRWDGGEVVTEFQWEKAARGPHPDRRQHSWGAEPSAACSAHPGPECPGLRFAADASTFPMAVSPFGVRMLGSLRERTSSEYTPRGYRWISDGQVDPIADELGDVRTLRGFTWDRGSTTTRSALVRQFSFESWAGIRCAY